MANKVKALQQWCKMQVEGYRDVNVTNMTSSWRSGLAFCALIHRYRPDLIDYDSLSKENVFENNELAFRVAKESLDIPDLLEAEDMLAMAVPDKLCIVTYVSQYYNVMRNLTPGGGPGKRVSPLKRPQTTTPPDETQAKRLIKEVKTKDAERPTATARSTTKVSLGDKCHICHQKVYLMERHLEGGKLYHRHCFRESQKSSFRAYRGGYAARQKDSKENISPTGPDKPSSNGTTNGTTAASAMSMAKMWDTKIADGKRPPAPSSVSPPSSAGTPSPALAEKSRFQLPPATVKHAARSPSALAPTPQATPKTSLSPTPQRTPKTSLSPTQQAPPKTSLSPTQQARPKTWAVQSNLKPRTARPWSPPSAAPTHTSQTAKSLSPVSPPSSSSSSSSSSPSQSRFTGPTSPSFQPRSFSPRSGALSPSAEGLFPHFHSEPASRNTTTATKEEAMEVDEDFSLGGRSAVLAKASASPPPRPPPPASPKSPTPSPNQTSLLKPLSPTSAEPRWKTDDSLKMNLLASLSNIRQRYDTKEDGEATGGASATDQQPSSISTQDSPKKADQPRSILKPEEGSGGQGLRRILKHKDPVSFTDCDPTKTPSDTSRPLRSILKAAGDTDPNPSVAETSPRSILKHYEEEEDVSPRPAGHSILKVDTASPSPSSVDTMAGDVLRKSILKTKDTSSSTCDSESTSHQDDSSRPPRSILKSRKSSGDSLLGSSGDELEDLSPRPILKTSPRAESVVSPTSEPRSILKTKNLPSHPASDSPRDSPKTILKSRESSPTRSMSPLRVMEPIKPILKKNIESPTPVENPAFQSSRSPTGPSVLKAQQSEDSPQSSSLFAAFKSTKTKNYTSSSLGLGSDEKAPLLSKNTESKDNFSTFSTNSTVAAAKSQQPEKGFAKGRQYRPDFDRDSNVSESNGAKTTTDKSQSLARAKEGGKPEWMIEAEKRQAARKGRYEDPEKVPVKKPDVPDKVPVRKPEVQDKVPVRKPQDKPSSLVPDKVSNGKADRKKAASQAVPMEVDDRPEWQKEAEKRQAMRKGNYVDPEKGPVRPKDRPQGDLTGKQASKDRPSKPPLPKSPPPSSMTAGGAAAKRPKSAMVPPPKPMRSPLPQRLHNKDRPMTELPTSLGKPRWQEEAERRQAALRQSDQQPNPTELQRNKKSRAPARPPPPTAQADKKKILPDSKFNFDDTVQTTNGTSEYAEIGPPSRRLLRGKAAQGEADRDSKFSNRPLPPVPADQDHNAPPKRRVAAEARLSSHTILRRLEELDAELQDMEQEGRQLEEKIRSESDDAMDEADLMIAWFELVNKKNELVRKESDLMYRQRQQELEGQHEELEYELRCLMDKTDKTVSEQIREEALLQELVETVMLRNNIVDSIEEDRIRYLEEDRDIAVMMEAKGFSHKEETTEEPTSPKKRNGKEKKKKDKNRHLVKSCVH